MTERLAELWSEWIESGLSFGLLVTLLSMAAVLWLASTILTARTAGRHDRSPFGWAFLVAFLPVLAMTPALQWPNALPWVAAGAAVFGALLALMTRTLIVNAEAECANGHPLSPTWIHCPHCPPPTPPSVARSESARAAGPANSGGAARPVMSPVPNPVGPAPVVVAPRPAYAPRPSPGHSLRPPAKTLVRLIPETPQLEPQVVTVLGAVIGRNPAADIALDDQSASWDHARIVDRDGSPAVVDLGSSNGTFVNDERVETSLLIPGDRLRVGETVFKVVS